MQYYSLRPKHLQIGAPPQGLDLSPYCLASPPVPPLYDLFAVSNHYGGLGGGHYTAYARLPGADGTAAGRWYGFDDSHVSEATPEQVGFGLYGSGCMDRGVWRGCMDQHRAVWIGPNASGSGCMDQAVWVVFMCVCVHNQRSP